MKTRTLLLLAVACGVAILGAGAALMFRLATNDPVAAPSRLGQPVPVGAGTVTVNLATIDTDRVAVTVTAAGHDGSTPMSFVLATPTPIAPSPDSTCTSFGAAPVTCELVFVAPGAKGSSLTLLLRHGSDRANWQLAR